MPDSGSSSSSARRRPPVSFAAAAAAEESGLRLWDELTVFVPALQSDLTQDISTSVLWVNSKPHMITLDYTIQVPNAARQNLPEVR